MRFRQSYTGAFWSSLCHQTYTSHPRRKTRRRSRINTKQLPTGMRVTEVSWRATGA